MDIITKKFGENLKKFRKFENLTQEKLAEMIGVNLRQLARIEAGESFVSSETLLNICKALNISPRKLFDYEIKSQSESETKNKKFLQEKNKEFDALTQNINKIKDNKTKLQFLNLAYNSLSDKKALSELKTMIKGIELILN